MTQKFHVEWIPKEDIPGHFDVKYYYEHQKEGIDTENLPYFELKEEYSEDFKYQQEVIQSIRLIDSFYYFEESMLPYIKEYKNIKLNTMKEV